MEEEEDAAMESPLPPPGTQHMSPPIHVQAKGCNCMFKTMGAIVFAFMSIYLYIINMGPCLCQHNGFCGIIPSVLSFMCIRTTILFALCKPLRKVSNV